MNNKTVNANKFRHPAELAMHLISFLINCVVIALLALFFMYRDLTEENVQYLEDVVGLDKGYAELFFEYKNVAAILLILIICYEIWHVIITSAGACMTKDLIVDELTFPALHAHTKEYAEKLGMKEVPHVFATYRDVGERVLNARIHEKAIIINQAAPGVASEMRNESVYDAHMLTEMIHIALHHRDFRLQALTFFGRCIPLYSQLYDRIMCYSADNVLKEVVGPEKAIEYICRQSYDVWTPCYLDMRKEALSKLTVYDRWKHGQLPLGTRLGIVFNEIVGSRPATMFRIVHVLGNTDYKMYMETLKQDEKKEPAS